MSPDDYLANSAKLQSQIKDLWERIAAHVRAMGNSSSSVIQPVLKRHQDAIEKLRVLDENYFGQPKAFPPNIAP